jgi:hypothetical protein
VAHAYNPNYSGSEIRRVTVPNQPWKIVFETLSQKTHYKKGLVEGFKV